MLLAILPWLRFVAHLPRVASLAYFTRIRPQNQSQRHIDTDYFRKFALGNVAPGQFLVVHGAKGIGKSCAIQTALQILSPVILTEPFPAGTNSTVIVNNALSLVANSESNVRFTASSILQWYKWLFKGVPVIVLSIEERKKGT